MLPVAKGLRGLGRPRTSSPAPPGGRAPDNTAPPERPDHRVPNHRRRPVARMSAITCSPGASSSTAGTNSNQILSSGSRPIGRRKSGCCRCSRRAGRTRPVLPQITVIGVSVIRMASRGGTMSSISAIAIAWGGVSSRTCTAIRRSPAPTPGGIRTAHARSARSRGTARGSPTPASPTTDRRPVPAGGTRRSPARCWSPSSVPRTAPGFDEFHPVRRDLILIVAAFGDREVRPLRPARRPRSRSTSRPPAEPGAVTCKTPPAARRSRIRRSPTRADATVLLTGNSLTPSVATTVTRSPAPLPFSWCP